MAAASPMTGGRAEEPITTGVSRRQNNRLTEASDGIVKSLEKAGPLTFGQLAWKVGGERQILGHALNLLRETRVVAIHEHQPVENAGGVTKLIPFYCRDLRPSRRVKKTAYASGGFPNGKPHGDSVCPACGWRRSRS